ncbi:MAG: hypothetical protein OHK006_25330 [Thermodesulfovibrionales bacterium]
MKHTIEWLRDIEHLAKSFYLEAAAAHAGDPDMAEFFLNRARDEEEHSTILDNALQYLSEHPIPASAITVDDASKETIQKPFLDTLEKLRAGVCTKKEVLDCMISTEMSEWNHVFLYVVDLLKKEREFMPAASHMHHHLIAIREFLKSLPKGEEYIPTMRNLPHIWQEQILIIDVEPSILGFLARLLADEGCVVTAVNGREALQMVTENYFDAIISDVKMPVMDGIEFLKQALEVDPDIARRTIFFSASEDAEFRNFVRTNNLHCLPKPSPTKDILAAVRDIIQSKVRAVQPD